MLKELDGLTQPIIDIYNAIELDLIEEIARRFDTYDKIGGTLEWQIKKLEELGALTAQTVKIIAKYSKREETEIKAMLDEAGFANLPMATLKTAYKGGLISVDPEKMLESPVIAATIEDSYKELSKAYKLIKTKAVESAKQAYMDVLNRAYIEVSSGVYDYNTSISKAIQRMATNGISGATYKRGDTVVKYSIEGTVRRDTMTAVNQLSNAVAFKSAESMGAEYVEISSHLGARISETNPIANHAGWQGKIFKIHGFDRNYGNLKTNTGYPDDILGLGGVNCRHRMFPFFPGISIPNPIQYDPVENEKAYKLSQQQRAKERKIRQTQKKIVAAEASNDTETAKQLKKGLRKQQIEMGEWCKENGVTRQPERETIQR